jgi:hypothetical protein
LHHKNANRPQTRSLACVKHAHKSQTLLTKPKATIATPLLNPATDTGVYRVVVVPSPTCASGTKNRQPETCLPSPANHQPYQKKTSKSITSPFSFRPQHDTPPLLESAQECICKPRVTQQWPLPSTSRNQPSLKRNPPMITIAPQKRNKAAKPLSRMRQTCTQITNSSYVAQSNHRNAAAQSRNRHGRVSMRRGAVANLRE